MAGLLLPDGSERMELVVMPKTHHQLKQRLKKHGQKVDIRVTGECIDGVWAVHIVYAWIGDDGLPKAFHAALTADEADDLATAIHKKAAQIR